ncbi:ribosomal RNA small subunit methyltransferase E [Holospora elegans E1]|uniref:Ribosomal RNA small subunit methyltransferase E n=1 Tax=Holospora elegans E1 TaxID=1427503 RepID=A0A023DYQ9_9PROT|nr:RsmE family RNA methyltransferase [Holospora elegans]GAJ45932.1 ribosomal RNA small subunit methyltransferase E [Holospora elegans E1]
MIRLFVKEDLGKGIISLSPQHVHYLHNVMRLKAGSWIEVFNGRDGGWKAICLEKTNKQLDVVESFADQPVALPALHLYISLFKRLDWALEKSTELGITHIHPIITQYSSVHRFNKDRSERIVQEAAEQSGRYTVPDILPVVLFEKALSSVSGGWVAHKDLFERKRDTKQSSDFVHNNLWIGPEGGWSPHEIKMFQNHSEIRPVCLNSLCLRSETAVVVGLTALKYISV